MRVLFLPIGNIDMASSRVRVYQYLEPLQRQGIESKTVTLDGVGIVSRFTYTCRVLAQAPLYDVVYIQKRLLPRQFLRLLRLMNPHIVFDFDDAVFTLNPYETMNMESEEIRRAEKAISAKMATTLRLCRHIVVGNTYLGDYAEQYNPFVSIIPTCIDLDSFKPLLSARQRSETVIGWVGTGEQHLVHLELLRSPLERVGQRHNITFRVIGVMGSTKMIEYLRSIRYVSVQTVDWIHPEQVPDEIGRFDIGVMPLVDNAWTRGKCGLKALEYMAMDVVPVCSPVGVNSDIIYQGDNGFLASTADEWEYALEFLIEHPIERKEIGKRARAVVESSYSTAIAIKKLLQVFEQVTGRKMAR